MVRGRSKTRLRWAWATLVSWVPPREAPWERRWRRRDASHHVRQRDVARAVRAAAVSVSRHRCAAAPLPDADPARHRRSGYARPDRGATPRAALRTGLVRAAAETGATIIDGGTASGVMAALGQAVAAATTPGATLASRPPARSRSRAANTSGPRGPSSSQPHELHPGQTDEWGGETSLLFKCSTSCPPPGLRWRSSRAWVETVDEVLCHRTADADRRDRRTGGLADDLRHRPIDGETAGPRPGRRLSSRVTSRRCRSTRTRPTSNRCCPATFDGRDAARGVAAAAAYPGSARHGVTRTWHSSWHCCSG